MELMASCFDKLLKLIQQPIPEPILGKLTVSVNSKILFFIIYTKYFSRQSVH